MSGNEQRLTLNPLVVMQTAEAGAILMHMSTGDCFELNRIGAEVWRMLQETIPVGQIISTIANKHEVPEATVESDVRALLDDLGRHGLLTVTRS